MPWRDHTGLPIHFHSSMISRSASRMFLRRPARVLARQSGSPAISWSIRSDGFIGSLRLEKLFGRSLRNQPSQDMAFPHPESRKENHRNDDTPHKIGILWNFFKRTINIAEYRNTEDEVNPAKDRTFSGFFHH